ncbi:hypothetical protein NTG1052_20074 [Candidatus Nitrotoga sp. 1052]|nr:hypothetical protein NTG1052_20074 [Candidatus Nitrotoga sp. 1052]
MEYPIDILKLQDKQWILDGVHRIAKHFMLGNATLPARIHDESIIAKIRVG